MPRRAALPFVLGLLLVAGVAGLGWRKLAAWHGHALVVGAAVIAAYLVWIAWELRVSARDARRPALRADRWTAEAYALAHGTTALSALLFATRWPVWPEAFLAGGTLAFACGVALRLWAVRALGECYSHRVRVAESHAIVQSGPYAWLRHPAYTGMLLAHAGLVMVFFNWIGAALLVVALLPAIVMRIRVEERALAAVPDYREYCLARARLVPWIW